MTEPKSVDVWEFETPEGHTVRISLSASAVVVATRMVHGASDGEVLDLDAFEERVLPSLEDWADPERCAALRAQLRALRLQRDLDDDGIP